MISEIKYHQNVELNADKIQASKTSWYFLDLAPYSPLQIIRNWIGFISLGIRSESLSIHWVKVFSKCCRLLFKKSLYSKDKKNAPQNQAIGRVDGTSNNKVWKFYHYFNQKLKMNLLKIADYEQLRLMFLLSSVFYMRRKHWNGENFRLPVSNEFTRFGIS